MKVEIEKIDKKPRCTRCGKEADYILKVRKLLYGYRCDLCLNCCIEKFKQLKVMSFREK